MLKTLVKFLFSLVLIVWFWSNIGQEHDKSQQKTVTHSLNKRIFKSGDYSATNAHEGASVTLHASSTPKGKKTKKFELDIELKEVESTSTKKFFAICDYFTSQFDIKEYEFLFLKIIGSPVVFKDFEYYSSHRSLYLILRVFQV